jgi:phospholipase C
MAIRAFDQFSIWSAPMAIQHLYAPYASASPAIPQQPFAVDPDAENWILNESDHPNKLAPGNNGFDDGPDWLAYVLNAVGGSAYWQNTAVVVTWDDWGGFYDNYSPTPWPFHATPNPYGTPTGNPQDPNEWGFRVPLIVISPYVKSRGYISSARISQGAILNFIETVSSLPLNALGGDDLTNQSNDLTDMLNLSATPLPWISLPSHFTPLNNQMCPTPTPSPTPTP